MNTFLFHLLTFFFLSFVANILKVIFNNKIYFQVFVGLHKINTKREEDAANNFTNLYVKNIGNMTVDELKELFAVSLLLLELYYKHFLNIVNIYIMKVAKNPGKLGKT